MRIEPPPSEACASFFVEFVDDSIDLPIDPLSAVYCFVQEVSRADFTSAYSWADRGHRNYRIRRIRTSWIFAIRYAINCLERPLTDSTHLQRRTVAVAATDYYNQASCHLLNQFRKNTYSSGYSSMAAPGPDISLVKKIFFYVVILLFMAVILELFVYVFLKVELDNYSFSSLIKLATGLRGTMWRIL